MHHLHATDSLTWPLHAGEASSKRSAGCAWCMPANPGAAAQWEANPGARAFYETAATAAAALGVRVDVFAACGGPCGLDALEPLAAGSGGALLLYPHVEQAALPQARGNAPARSRHGSIPRAAFFGFL